MKGPVEDAAAGPPLPPTPPGVVERPVEAVGWPRHPCGRPQRPRDAQRRGDGEDQGGRTLAQLQVHQEVRRDPGSGPV